MRYAFERGINVIKIFYLKKKEKRKNELFLFIKKNKIIFIPN